MPTYDVQFVDSIAASPGIRLDLRAQGWKVLDATRFGTPELRRAAVTTLLADGDQYPAAAYGNRTITLVVRIDAATDDLVASMLQQLMRELDRPRNILRYRPNTTSPVFFRTYRAGPDSVVWNPFEKVLTASIPAEPFGLGLREDLPQVTVYADPAEGVTINSNPFFEVDTSGWVGSDGTIARSTAQAHEGAASLLLTPDGVGAAPRAEFSPLVPVAAGETYRVSAWVRCAVARTVEVAITWFTSAGVFIVSSGNALPGGSVAANTWTFASDAFVAPAGAAQASIRVRMTGTPPTSNLLWIDEARIRKAGGVGGCCFDLTGIKGDVETPLYLTMASTLNPNFVTSDPGSSRVSAIAVRRRGNPSQMPFVLQAEAMSVGADTSVQANDAKMSGAGSNYCRTTFATNATMQTRLSASWPSGASVDIRGQYRVFMRYRQSAVSGSPMQARLLWGSGTGVGTSLIVNDTVALVQFDYASLGSPALKYVDLGVVQFPMGFDPVADGPDGVELPVEGMAIIVQAARTSGSTSLDTDLLLFVPADDGLLLVTWPASPTLPSTLTLDAAAGQVYVEGASGMIGRAGAQLTSSGPMVSPGVSNRITFIRDVGTLSSTGGGATGDDITATTVVAPYYWPQYLYARPLST